jgi:Flp pilus assembly protein TadD
VKVPGVAIPNREALEAKLVDNPKDVATLSLLIKAALSVKDFPLARLLSLRALELDEKNADTLNLLGVASFQANMAQAASEAFKKALKVNGRHPQSLANLGAVYFLYGDESRGKDYLGKAGSVDVSSPDILPQVRSMGGAR